jgi:hypothetical protein
MRYSGIGIQGGKQSLFYQVMRCETCPRFSPNNLISIGCLTDNGHAALFTPRGVKFKPSSGTIFREG